MSHHPRLRLKRVRRMEWIALPVLGGVSADCHPNDLRSHLRTMPQADKEQWLEVGVDTSSLLCSPNENPFSIPLSIARYQHSKAKLPTVREEEERKTGDVVSLYLDGGVDSNKRISAATQTVDAVNIDTDY